MKKYNLIVIIIALILPLKNIAQPTNKEVSGVPIDRIIGTVGDKIIKVSDVESQYLQMQAQGIPVNANTKCKIFEELLVQKLLINQAIIDSVEVSDMQVMSEIERRVAIFSERAGGDDKLVAYFGKSIPEIKKDFEDIVKDQLLMQQMQQNITGEIKASPKDVSDFYKSIPKDSLPFIATQIEMSQIIIEPVVTFEAKRAAKEKLEGFRKRIVDNGDDFSVLASLYSDDPGSAANGGELGFMGKGDLVKEFGEVAFKLEKGETSKVVETDFGYHIIQLVEMMEDEGNFRHILVKPSVANKAKLLAKNRLDSISQLIRIDTLTFAIAALRYSTDENTRNNGGVMVNPYTGDSKFEQKQIHPSISYVVKNLKIGQISDPFLTTNDKGREVYSIIKLDKKTEAHVADLKNDYKLIQDMTTQMKSEAAVKKWVAEKLKATYIKIDEAYQTCEFEEKTWLK